MDASEWRKIIGEMVREHMRSPQLEYYFSVRMNKPRAQVLLKQLGLYIRHRRDCWAHVSGNCPVMAVKQKILGHEYGEVIKDQYSEFGHLDLIVRQAKAVGLEADDILKAEPIPSTMATLYAWAWITRAKPWIEGLAALTVTEWSNDDRLLGDQGGGHSSRMAKRWMEDMGLKWKDMPNFSAHREADEEHSDMFLPFLSEHATGKKEKKALDAVKESLDLFALYREGVAKAMEMIPLD
ncbi:MAG TPA: iron-containing redox enzyme family protein [Terriglobales bacterium]|nr:iron-containing redox enzyme family protein [Terriglobales bacterium]